MRKLNAYLSLWAFHKRRPQSGGEGKFAQCGILRTRGRGSSNADVRTF